MHLRAIQIVETDDSDVYFPEYEPSYQYLGLCLSGEAGEVANLIKKFERGSITELELIEELEKELPDILIYLVMLASHAGIDLEEMYEKKKEYNEHRFGPAATAQ